MPKFIDLTSVKFHRLTVIKRSASKGKGAFWECLCDCGKTITVFGQSLRTGNTRSCGCLQKDISKITASKINKSHGKTRTKIYRAWTDMHSRCKNKNVKNYHNYGGRGITVCDEWGSFETFLKDMGDAPDGCSIDRIDTNQGYSKNNCRWADRITQQNNTTTNRFLTFMGKTMTIANWARQTGINEDAISGRLNIGWSVEDSLTKPISKRSNNV